jgi:hypothetical protein
MAIKGWKAQIKGVNILKKNILGLFTVFCMVNLSACFSSWEGDSGEGSLTISIGSPARSIFYDIDDDKLENFFHEVSLINADGEKIIDQQPFSGSVTLSVPSGTYTVTVKGFDVDKALRSYGTKPAEVVPGKNTPVLMKMYSAVKIKSGGNWSDLISSDFAKNSDRKLYVFLNENITIEEPGTVELNNGVDVTLITEAADPVGITWNTTGSMFSISGKATLRLGVKDQSGTITLTGSDNNTAPLINVNGGKLIMDGVTISGNKTSGSGGGVSVIDGGTLHIVTGTIYGSNEADTKLRNTSATGAALYQNSGTVEYGTFSGEKWNGNSDDSLDTTNETIRVVNGKLLSIRLTGTASIAGSAAVGQTLTAVTTALGGSGTIF